MRVCAAGGEIHPGSRGQGRGREGGRVQAGRGDGALQGRRRRFPRGENRGRCPIANASIDVLRMSDV